MLRARIPDLEDRDKYAREVMRTFKSTITKVKLWMTACLHAARNLATRIPGFTPAYIRVLSAMLSFAKTTGLCWANQENIARAAGCCDRTVRRAQKFFRECGLLIDEGYHKSGTRRFFLWSGENVLQAIFSPRGVRGLSRATPARRTSILWFCPRRRRRRRVNQRFGCRTGPRPDRAGPEIATTRYTLSRTIDQ